MKELIERVVAGVVVLIIGAIVGISAHLWSADIQAIAARLHPIGREIIVREAVNGYVVEAHTRNNPYPYAESVYTTPTDVGMAVAGLLNERAPLPKWGK